MAKYDGSAVLHTGPGTLAGRYLRRFWQPIHLSRGVPSGRAAAVRIMSEEFTLYRDEGGEAHLLDARCAHRGTQLSVGWVEGDSIRCMYHGWKYAPTGQCIEQPAEPQPFCHKIRIRSYPVREYLGAIFAYLGEGEPPPFPRYERFEAPGVAVLPSAEISPFNYFQRLENSHDFTHAQFVHHQAYPTERTLDTVIPRLMSEECEWGMKTHRFDPHGQEVIQYFGMPNINYIIGGVGKPGREWEGAGEALFIRVPVDDEHHLHFEIRWVNDDGKSKDNPRLQNSPPVQLVNKVSNELLDAVFAGTIHLDEITYSERKGFNLFWLQDNVSMLAQGVRWERKNEHLGRADVPLILMRKLWARELRALAQRRSLQEWRRTPDMVPRVAALPRAQR